MPVRCAECNCTPRVCMDAESPGECRGCSQASGPAAECCCWNAVHGIA